MITKKELQHTPPPIQEERKKSEYFELKLPRPVFTDVVFSPLIIVLLVAFSFMLGMQTARIRYMDSDLARLQSITQAQANTGKDTAEPKLGTKIDMDIGTLPTLGNKNAKVTIIEFSDFQCPFCKQFFDSTFPQLKKEYIDTGKVQFAFRHLPLDIHPNAPKAGEAAECANDQQKFWEYHDELFKQFDSWVNEPTDSVQNKFTDFAGGLGINTQEFSTCLTSGKYAQKVNDDMTVAQNAGATGTPTFFINGQMLVGAFPYETFKTLLDQELNK